MWISSCRWKIVKKQGKFSEDFSGSYLPLFMVGFTRNEKHVPVDRKTESLGTLGD